jgi:hypothetical protein
MKSFNEQKYPKAHHHSTEITSMNFCKVNVPMDVVKASKRRFVTFPTVALSSQAPFFKTNQL